MLLGCATNQAAVEKAISTDLPLIYGYLDEQVGSRAFLAGEQFSIADVASASFFRSMQQAGAAPDPTCYPNLTRYVAQQHSRPSVARLIEQETKGDGLLFGVTSS
jgi:glutathione S-transferase